MQTRPLQSTTLYEKFRNRFYAVLAEFHLLPMRIFLGHGHIQGPLFNHFGKGLFVNIRGKGLLRYGRFKSRNNLVLYCSGGNITIGNGVFMNNNCSLTAMSSITIGDNTMLGEGVRIYDNNHAISADGIPSGMEYDVDPVSIGRHCWIGSNVVILKGVHICDKVVIGANAVVSKSIEESGIYVMEGASKLRRLR